MGLYNAAAWLLDRHLADGRGGRTACVADGDTVTYGQLAREVFRAQHALRFLDVRRGERVVLVLDDEPAFPAWFLGALRSGAVPVPISTMLTGAELAGIVADSEAGTVVVSEPYRDHLGVMAAASPELRAAVVIGKPPGETGVATHAWDGFSDDGEAPLAATREDSPAFWLYTSGTTGSPKAAMHRHGSLQATADTYGRHVLRIGPDDRCLSVAKLFFAFGLGNSLTFPFSVAASAVLDARRPTPAGVAALARAQRPTLFFASPGFLAALCDADVPDDSFASVRATVTAGETLPAAVHDRFRDRFGTPVLDGLGSTEALHIFLSNTLERERPGTSGVPVPGYDLRLLDDDGRPTDAVDAPGRLQVRGPSLATGYWCRDAATRAALVGEWLSTGDVYLRTAGGDWVFRGRTNDMIKAGGIWVSPAEVEGVLVAHPDVAEAAVVGGRDAAGLEITVAFVVPRAGHAIDETAIEAHCRARMAAFKRPRRLVVVDELPKTATGKVRRFALRESLSPERS